MRTKIYRAITTGICLITFLCLQSFSQSLIVEAGYARIATESGYSLQSNFDRYFSNRFGILANVTYAATTASEDESNFQLGFTSGLFFQIFDFQHHLLLTEAGAGTSYYEPKKQTFAFFYWSLDYFYKISSRHFIGVSAGLNGGDHSTQFVNVNYLFNTYSKDKNFNQQKSNFVLMAEPTIIFTKPSASAGLNVIGAYEIGSVISLGIGSGFSFWQSTSAALVPVFADVKLNFLPGKIKPYSIFRFGYNITSNVAPYQGFVDIGLGLNVSITQKHGVYADCKLRKSRNFELLEDQSLIVATGYKFSF